MHARIGWQNLRTSEFLDVGDYMLITGTDFEDGKVNYSTCHYVEKERYDQDKNIQIKNGSILITKDGTLGKVAYVEGLSMPATLNAGVFNVEIKNKNETDGRYLFQFLKAPFLMDYVAQKATGGTIKHLNQNILVDFPISSPSKEEQTKIGEYFSSIDHLITLHQRKYLQEKKTSLTWEQRKWIDSVDISTEMVDPTSSEYADMPHIAPGNIESFTGRILDNVKTVKEEQLISGKFRFRPDDVVYGKINPQLGKYFYASVDGLTSADAYVFKGKNGTTQKFLFSLLQTNEFFKYSVSVSKRSGMPKINRDELNAYRFFSPNKEEQDKIGDLLLGIDHLITLHRRAHFHRRRRTYK